MIYYGFPRVPFYTYVGYNKHVGIGYINNPGFCLETEHNVIRSQFKNHSFAPPFTMVASKTCNNDVDESVNKYIINSLYDKIDMAMWRLLVYSLLCGNTSVSNHGLNLVYCNSNTYKKAINVFTHKDTYQYNNTRFILNKNLDPGGYVSEQISEPDINIGVNKRLLQSTCYGYSKLEFSDDSDIRAGFVSIGGLIADAPGKMLLNTVDIINMLN